MNESTDIRGVTVADLAACRDRIRRRTGLTESVSLSATVDGRELPKFHTVLRLERDPRDWISAAGYTLAEVEERAVAAWAAAGNTHVRQLQVEANALGFDLVPLAQPGAA